MQTTHSSLTRQRQQQARALCREARGEGLNLGKKVSVPKDVMMEELNLTSNRGSRMFQERQRRVDRFTVENTADTSTVSYDNLDHNQGHSAAPVQGGKENLSCLVPGKRSPVTTLKKNVAMKGSPGVLAAGYTGPLKEIPREKFNITVIPRSYCSPWREALGECEEIPASLNTQPEKLQPVNYRCFNRSPMPFGGRTHSKRVTTPHQLPKPWSPKATWPTHRRGRPQRPNFNRAPRGWGSDTPLSQPNCETPHLPAVCSGPRACSVHLSRCRSVTNREASVHTAGQRWPMSS
ncbi:myozenin-2 [Electrophorus electricus]|uniref:Myozenin 3a n=1 Tax=Electrophorus electricus TaxID=8005 RepID=A0AAY5EUB3_ELEEL|nr:myozenin-2 [Electrophorus electricus]